MAALIAPVAPAAPTAHTQDVFASFQNSFNQVTLQLAGGMHSPIIPFTEIKALGTEGIKLFKAHVEYVTHTDVQRGLTNA